MNEAETRVELIDPALKAAGWALVDGSRVRREVIAPGRLIEAQNSDLRDVLAYIAFNPPPVSRAERVNSHRHAIFQSLDYR